MQAPWLVLSTFLLVPYESNIHSIMYVQFYCREIKCRGSNNFFITLSVRDVVLQLSPCR